MAASVDRRIEANLYRDMGQRDPAGLIRPRSTEPIRACGHRPRTQAGHMTASDLTAETPEKSLRAGGHPHMSRPSTWIPGTSPGMTIGDDRTWSNPAPNIRPAPQHRAFSCYALRAQHLGEDRGDAFVAPEPGDRCPQ